MYTIHNRHGVQVDHAESFTAAMRLVDYYQRTALDGPYTARPVKVDVVVTTQRLSLMDRFFRFFGVTA